MRKRALYSQSWPFNIANIARFGMLASFLQANQPSYATRINEPGHRISTLTYPGHPFPPDLCEVVSKLPEGFSEVALSRSIATELISFLVKLTELVKWMSSTQAERLNDRQPGLTIQRAIYDLQCLSVLSLTIIEGQIVRAILAFCLHVYDETFFQNPVGPTFATAFGGFQRAHGNSSAPLAPKMSALVFYYHCKCLGYSN